MATQNDCNFGTGTSGQVLTSNGVGVAPTFQTSATGGRLVLIQSQVASSSASLTFTTGITSTYNDYFLLCTNYSLSASFPNIVVQISTNGGSSYIATGYTTGYVEMSYNSTTWSNANSTIGLILNSTVDSNSYCNTQMYLYNMTSGANYVQFSGTGQRTDNGGATKGNLITGTYNTVSQTVNAIKIVPSSGNINTGRFSLFGILET